MAVLAGYNGSVTFNAGDPAWELHNWTLDIEVEDLDVTDYGHSGWRNSIQGLKSWSGTITGYWDTTLNILGSATGANTDEFIDGSAASGYAVTLYGGGVRGFTGNVHLTGISVGTEAQAAGSAPEVTFTFRGTGALTLATTS